MAVFQRPPQSEEEAARYRPLDIGPDQVLELDEDAWYEKVYRGDDVPQLTLRAVLVGSVLGFLLAFTNLYVGLKTGWHFGVAITAAILAYAGWNGLVRTGVAKTQLTILETNAMASTASAAGYSTGSTMVSAIAALLMLSATAENPAGAHLPWPLLVAWTFFLAVLGTVLAIPMKRNLINRERLKFPSGIAAAVTLQSLYSEGTAALRKARALLWSGLFGALVHATYDLKLFREVAADGKVSRHGLLPESSPALDFVPALGRAKDGAPHKLSDWGGVLDHNPLMVAAGMIVGMRMALWMLLGGALLVWGVGPWGLEQVWTNPKGVDVAAVTTPGRAWREIGLWLGVSILLSSSLASFALQWRTIVRAFGSLGGGEAERKASAEVPMSWFATGVIVAGGALVVIAWQAFEVPLHYGVLAVIMTFFLSLVAARATGEADFTPTGALGKVMQLTYGVLIPQSMTANLMTASITSSSAASSADLLTDLKSGYLLGADPRRQFIAQLSGVLSGTIATVIGFYLLVPDATALNGTDTTDPVFPAPSAQTWKAVAELFSNGLDSMHPVHQNALGFGLGLGVLLVLLEALLPRLRAWLPSATGLGLGMIIPFQYPISFFLGAVIAWVWTRRSPASAEDYLVPISAGVIAGVSILGVIAAFLNNVVLT